MDFNKIATKVEHKLPSQSKNIIYPSYLTNKLSEEIGIHIGDGSLMIIPKKKSTDYLYAISGSKDDLEFLFYVRNLIYSIFGLIPTQFRLDKNAYLMEYYCKALVLWKKMIGLPVGKKQNIKIPQFIERSPYVLDCIRGIVDTDGCLMFKNKSRDRYYPVIKIQMKSKPLIKQLYGILIKYGFVPSTMYDVKQESGWGQLLKTNILCVNGIKNFNQWINLIGFSNPVNITKVKIWQKFGFYFPKTTLYERKLILGELRY